MKAIHFLVGIVGVSTFLFTGAYLRMTYPAMTGVDPGMRMLLRSRHIYILLVSLVNLAVGIYYVPYPRRWRRALQQLGSLFIVASPFFATAAFFLEPPDAISSRPFTDPAIKGIFAGMILQTLGGIGQRRMNEPVKDLGQKSVEHSGKLSH